MQIHLLPEVKPIPLRANSKITTLANRHFLIGISHLTQVESQLILSPMTFISLGSTMMKTSGFSGEHTSFRTMSSLPGIHLQSVLLPPVFTFGEGWKRMGMSKNVFLS